MWSDAADLKLRQRSQLPRNLLCLLCQKQDTNTQAHLRHEHDCQPVIALSVDHDFLTHKRMQQSTGWEFVY